MISALSYFTEPRSFIYTTSLLQNILSLKERDYFEKSSDFIDWITYYYCPISDLFLYEQAKIRFKESKGCRSYT